MRTASSTKVLLICLAIAASIHCNGQPRTLVFATYAYSTNNRLGNIQPIADYLARESGLPVKAVSYPSVHALIQALEHDSVDFAMMNTSGYLVLQRNHPGKARALVNLDLGHGATTNYGGCLITSKKSDIRSIRDIAATRGRSLALVSPSSTSGNLVPRLLLNQHKVPHAEDILQVTYLGTHRQVVEAVLTGKADLGGCGCAEVDKARDEVNFEDQPVVIGSFNDIPLGPIVSASSLDNKIVDSIRKLLLEIDQRNPAAFSVFCSGWTEFKDAKRFKRVRDREYNAFRRMFGSNEALWSTIH